MSNTVNWPKVLKIEDGSTISEQLIGEQFRELAKVRHPDHGGSTQAMQELIAARKAGLDWCDRERKRIARPKVPPPPTPVQRAQYANAAAYQSQSQCAAAQAAAFQAEMFQGLAGNAAAGAYSGRPQPTPEQRAKISWLNEFFSH